MDVVAVEGGEIFVVEARPLAHEHVPGLERVGRRLVVHDVLDAAVDAHHLVDIGVFLAADFFFLGERGHRGLLLRIAFADSHRLHAARFLPAGASRRGPIGIGRLVVAEIDAGRGALEDVELFGSAAEARDCLNGAGAGADDADDLVRQFGEILAGVVVIPTRGVERVALERFHAGYFGELGLGQRAVGADHEFGLHRIAAIGADVPELFLLVPGRRGDRGAEDGEIIEVVAPRDRLAMRENLRPLRILMRRHVFHFVEQRQVVVGRHIAGGARVTVPIPGAADIGAAFDNADAHHAALTQPCGGEQGRKTAADEEDFDGVGDRGARGLLHGFEIGIDGVFRQRRGVGDVLRRALGPVFQAQVALGREFALDAVIVVLRRPLTLGTHALPLLPEL